MNDCVHHDHTIVEDYIRSLQWSPATTDHEKSLIAANVRGFYAHMLATAPPANVLTDLINKDSIFRMSCWLAEHEGCDDPHHLIWEGNPPEPWGEVWNKYEDTARAALTAALESKHG
jgi:hypothetical protein